LRKAGCGAAALQQLAEGQGTRGAHTFRSPPALHLPATRRLQCNLICYDTTLAIKGKSITKCASGSCYG
jgi:hypothetical protein